MHANLQNAKYVVYAQFWSRCKAERPKQPLLSVQATAGDPACAEHRDDMSLDSKRLMGLKSTLQKGQDIWLELYFQVFKNVCCLSKRGFVLLLVQLQ